MSTYQLIASNTLSASASSITFSSISSSYVDLSIRFHMKGIGAGNFVSPLLTFNGNSSALYSQAYILSPLSSADVTGGNSYNSQSTYVQLNRAFPGTNAGSAWSDMEIYMTNYANFAASSANKNFWAYSLQPNDNATSLNVQNIVLTSGQMQLTSAINSFTLASAGNSFAAGTSVSLYGIKNS